MGGGAQQQLRLDVRHKDDHWNVCSDCGKKQNVAAHEFKWVIDKDATATESGSQHEECTICGFKKACVEILPVGPSAPQTGDNNRVESSLAVMLLALGGIAAAITIGRKKSRMAK